jgi:hypothetical protein
MKQEHQPDRLEQGPMNALKIVAIVLTAAGTLGLVPPTHLPLWASLGAIVMGGVLLLFAGKAGD